MNNLHISLTAFRHESRVLKEVCAIKKHGLAKRIFIAALHEGDLPECQIIQDNIEVKRFILSTRNWSKNFVVQIVKYLEFILRLSLFYNQKNISLINIHSLDLLPVGIFLKYFYGAKLIYDTHELETETNGTKGIRKKLVKWVEKLFIQYADDIFVVSNSIAEEYASMYKIPLPHVVLNCPEYSLIEKGNLFNKKFNIPDNFIIFLYQGGVVRGRGVQLILEAFKKIERPGLAVVFMGYGPLEDDIKSAATLYPNIYYHPAVPPQDLFRYTSSADVGFSIIENTCMSYYYCLPNKLFEYTMAGLPVIVSNMKEMSSFVTTNNIGVVTESENVDAVIEAIFKITEMDLPALRENALQAAKLYNWEEQEKVMISAYKHLIGTTK